MKFTTDVKQGILCGALTMFSIFATAASACGIAKKAGKLTEDRCRLKIEGGETTVGDNKQIRRDMAGIALYTVGTVIGVAICAALSIKDMRIANTILGTRNT